LGIAYIDFLTEEQANLAKEKLNAEKLCGRQLKAKSFIPYSPNVRRSGSNTRADENTPMSSIDAVEEEEKKNIEESSPSSKIDNFAEVGETTPTRPVSDVTVYIGRLPSKVTDGDLREYFHEYVPTEVYIFKSRNMRSHKPFFRHGVVSALVTLSSENGLSRALEQLKDVKLKGRVLHLKAAYISKVEEVKRAAEARQKKLEESTSGMHAAEENAVPEEGTVVEGEPTI
jgi:RNA recognition motif-containing protein